jgi:carbonic anhydrase
MLDHNEVRAALVGASPCRCAPARPASLQPFTPTLITKSNASAPLTQLQEFVSKGEFKQYHRPDPPSRRSVIVTCMDSRLTHLLPHALNLQPGSAKVIKNAGAVITHPFGGIMRSVVVALYELNADEVFVVAHHDCGMTQICADTTVSKMLDEGQIPQQSLSTLEHSGIDVRGWLRGFRSVEESVRSSVAIIRHHPLVPKHVPCHGLVMHPETGKLDLVVDGYECMPQGKGEAMKKRAAWSASTASSADMDAARTEAKMKARVEANARVEAQTPAAAADVAAAAEATAESPRHRTGKVGISAATSVHDGIFHIGA